MKRHGSREHNIAVEMGRCKHFNGVHHKACEAGVSYVLFRGPGMLKLPCISQEGAKACAASCYPTREEAEHIEDARHEAVEAFLRKGRLGICATCDGESTDWVQNGPCIYSRPCGHRVGQGNAAQYKAGVLEARAARGKP